MTERTSDHHTPAGDPAADRDLHVVLTAHRSLGPTGFVMLMGAFGFVCFATGLVFLTQGAWPVMGFFGFDVALLYIAFKLNYRSGRLYETVDLTPETLTVTRVQPSGKAQSWSFNPYWVRLSLEERIGRSSELSLASHGDRLVFASFLSDSEREDFAAALRAALSDAKSPTLNS